MFAQRAHEPAQRPTGVCLFLLELLLCAVIMLVDWLVGSLRRSRGEALGAAEVFSTFGFRRKSMLWHIFRAESEALADRRGRRPGRARATRKRRVEDSNRGTPEAWRESGRPASRHTQKQR